VAAKRALDANRSLNDDVVHVIGQKNPADHVQVCDRTSEYDWTHGALAFGRKAQLLEILRVPVFVAEH
jgi:hypothetical protein